MQDLFTEAYEELNLTKQEALQEEYILAYNQLGKCDQDAFDVWAKAFTPKLQESTDFNRLGESNACYNAWENNSSTFFSPAAVQPKYCPYAGHVYENSRP